MKTLFAALASALVVSTAFAQTATPSAPQSAQPAPMQPAGQANLKASTAVQTGATANSAAATKAPAKAANKSHVKKVAAHPATKPHKINRKDTTDTSAAKNKTESAKEASNAPAKADGTKTDTTRTQ